MKRKCCFCEEELNPKDGKGLGMNFYHRRKNNWICEPCYETITGCAIRDKLAVIEQLLAKHTQEKVEEILTELMEEVSELRFDEWREPIDKVYKLLKAKLKRSKE